MAYPATPKTWVAGDVLTAAQLNAELRDALLAIFPLGPPDVAWTAYTPTLTQSGAVTKTVTYAKYTKVGRLITVQWDLAVTGAGTGANPILIGLPVTAAQSSLEVGTGIVLDASAGATYKATLAMSGTTAVGFRSTSGTASTFLGQDVMTAALAAGDVIRGAAFYEAAT